MDDVIDAGAADRELKQRHQAMWALGDYPSVAADLVWDLGPELVRACGLRGGERVLDVAAGTGNAAIPAALAGAKVVASDLTPELLDAGRRLADGLGAALEWRRADAEALPFADGEFDAVLSCFGAMFAPHHQACADELLRVCRPGGTIGLLNWTPEGFIGQMFTTLRPYVPPPPPGAQPPPLWGRAEHVRGLFGERADGVEARHGTVRVDRFGTPEEFRDYFRDRYGPVIAAYRAVGGDPERTAELDRDLAELARRNDDSAGAGPLVMHWEYLLLTARRAG